MTKMREYVDEIQGSGAWDGMHDLIGEMSLVGWDMPPVTVDGKVFHVFPGTNREATVEEVQAEIRRALALVAAGDCEIYENFDNGSVTA